MATDPRLARLRRAIVPWYREHRRELPWRGLRDPWAVWVSEIMLQQTRVSAAIPFYERFMERFPTVESLAESDLDEVLRYWAGLGYYARARSLHKGARWVCEQHGGVFPSDPNDARAVPGVGPYTVGAVLSIVYGARLPAVDANAERVLGRALGLEGKAAVVAVAGELVPARAPGEWNQALMELGALVCRAREPLCAECPLARTCVGRASLAPAPARQRRPVSRSVCVLLERRARILVGQRPLEGLWGGLWELPWAELAEGESPLEAAARAVRESMGLTTAAVIELGSLRHGLMERTLELTVCRASAQGRLRATSHTALLWANAEQLAALAMPQPHRQAVERFYSKRTSSR